MALFCFYYIPFGRKCCWNTPTTNKYTPILYIDKMVIALYLEPILDPLSKEYANVLTVDTYPEGPLKDFVKQKRLPELSEFKKTSTTKCKYVLVHPDTNEYMELPFLFSYLQANGYTIEYQMTKLYKQPNVVCLFTYTVV
jgi:hypothetical protein